MTLVHLTGYSIEQLEELQKQLKEAKKAAKEAAKEQKAPTFNSLYRCVNSEGEIICDCPGITARAGRPIYCGAHESNKLKMVVCTEVKTWQVGNFGKKKDKVAASEHPVVTSELPQSEVDDEDDENYDDENYDDKDEDDYPEGNPA